VMPRRRREPRARGFRGEAVMPRRRREYTRRR
jgi:hypothetical protein